jgi:hypothetical protein
MNDKLKKLYDLYVQSGLIQSTDFKAFSNANDQQRKKLYDLGKQSGLFKTTDYNTFNSAFNVAPTTKKKSITVSQSVQPKKSTSSATMPSWMQSSLEQSSKKEQTPKKPTEQQRQGVYVEKKETKAPEVRMGLTGIEIDPLSKEQKRINASVGSTVFSGFPGQEENKYRIKDDRWQRLYGTKWTDVTNEGSVSALNNYFEKNLKTFKGEVNEEKQDLKRMRSVMRVEEEIASGKKYNEKQFEERVQYYNTVETQKYLRSKGYDIEVNGIKDDPKTLKALASANAKKKIDQGKDFEIEDMRDAVDGIITNKFLMRTEEDAISVLRKQFGKHGFIFEESGAGTDYIKVTTPGGVEKEFGFDYSNPEIARAEASNMSNFIKRGYMTKSEKKQFEGEDVDMDDRKQRDEYFFDLVNLMGKNPYKYSTDLFSYDEMNNGMSRIYSDLKAESKSLEYEYKDIEKRIEEYNANPNDVKEKIAIDKDLYALKKKGIEIKEKYNKLENTEKNLQKITGLEFAKKEKEGNFLGIITGQFAQGLTNIEKAVLNLSADILPYAIGEDVVDSQTRFRLKEEGYTDDQILDYASKQLKRTVVKDITEGITRAASAGSTTKEYINSEDRNDLEKTVSFLSESIGTAFSAGGNPVLQKIAFFTQSYNGMEEQMSSPEFDGLTEWEKKLISVPYGFVIGALERYGFAALGAGKNPVVDRFARNVIASTLKTLPKDASVNTIKREINKSVSRMIGQGALRVVGGAAVEGGTEGTQQLAEIAGKNLSNAITEKDYFKDVPDITTAKGLGEALDAAKTDAYYGFLGGLLYSTVSNSLDIRRDHKFNKRTDEEFKLFYAAMTDNKIVQANKLQVKLDLKNGKITKEQAQDRINSINDMNAKLTSINSNLSLRDKKDAFNLILEREKLTKEKAPLDEALQAPYNDRITEINNELKVISENAIKASEKQEGTAEGGSIQREGVVEGQPEVGQGEGTVGQTTEQGTDTGNRTGEGQKKVTGRIAINRPGILSSFGGQQFDTPLEGDTYVEGQRVMFEEKGTGRVYDLGNVNEMMDNEIEGLTQVEESIVVQSDGKLSVDGNNWNIQTDLPTMGIEYNPAGEVTRVSLKDDNGNTTMFDGQKAVDIAYQIELQKIQSPEQQQLINDLLEQDEEFQAATADIELTEAPNVVQEETATDTKPTAKPTVTAAAAPKITETTDTKAYSEALSEAKAELKAEGNGLDLQVSDVSQEEADAIVAEGGKIFMTEDGLAGAYVKKDGYMGGLFKSPKATYKKIAKLLQQARIKVGGRFMDAYATELEKIYVENGFRPVARLKFNEEYAPEGWDAPGSALASKPDVVFFAYDPDGKYSIGDGEYVEDYDAAYEMAKNFDPEASKDKEKETAKEADKLAELMKGSTVVEGTNEQIDALIKEISDSEIVETEAAILNSIKKAVKALKIILPNVKFVIHSTDASFVKATGESSRGAYDPDKKTIHINLTSANRRTVMHEVFHAIIISRASSDAKLQNLTKNMVNSVIRSLKQSGSNQNVIDYLELFASNYKDNLKDEEKLSELYALLGENNVSLPPVTQNIIQRFLDRIAKMLGLKEMTDNEVIEFMNTLSGKVATGTEITDNEFKVGKGTVKSAIKRFQANFKDEVSGLEFVYDKNGDEFAELEKNGFITKDRSITNFDGQYMFFHQPDAAFSGMIVKRNKKNGEVELLIEGKGGMYYPIKFHENGFFWASTSKVAEKMANDLNEAMEQNGGKLLMALTSAPYDKLLSSTTAANSVMELISSKAFDRNFAISPAQLKNILINAAAFTKEQKTIIKDKNKKPILDKNGNVQYRIKNVGLGIKIKKGDSLEDVKSKIKELLDPDAKSFADRKTFVEAMIKETVDIINSNPKAISQFGEFFSTGIQNKYFKGTRKKGYNISVANMKQALSEMLTEPMLKEGVNRDKGGQIYAIIELDGKVKPVDSDLHESYPKAIQSVDPKNNKVKLHILTDRVKWNEVVEDFETNDIVAPGDRELEIFPTSGISVRALKVNTKNIVKEEKTSEVENKSNIRQQKPLEPEVAEKLTEDGKGNFVFNHYSDKKRDVIKPGTGQNMITSREEASALSAVGGLAQYYTMDMQKEPGTGPNQHTILIPKERVYYFNKDQEGFYDEAKRRFEEVRPGQAFNPNYQVAFITQVANDNGYDIVVANWRNGELRAQTTMELTPSDKIIEFKPLKKVTYEVGDTIEVYGTKAKITAIDGDIITFKGETAGGSINFKRSPKSIQKVATPKAQVEEEVKSLDDEIDTDKSNFRRQKASDQAAVIVKTGKEAGLSDAGIREYMKRNGYTDRQATDAIQAYNDKKEGIFIDPNWSKLRKAAVIFKRRFLLSRGLMPNSAFASYEQSQANTAKDFNKAEKILADFNRAMNKVSKADKDKVRKDFDEYVRGDKSVSLPLDLKKSADAMRAHIDSISISLINSGVVDEHLAQKIKDNLGSYFTRSYRVHDRANWKNEVEENIKQKAINLLKIQYMEMAKEKAAKENMDVQEALDNLVTNALNDMLTKSGAENFVSGGKKGSKDLSILKERQDIPLEIRMLMGEYTDPAQNYARTILKMSALAANHQFLTEVKKNGTGVFLFEKNDPRRPKNFDYEIAAEGSETMNPLNGMYTTKEIGKQFEEQSSQLKGVLKWTLETYMRLLSSVKWGKTIGSLMTHAKNVFGNLGFILVNGHWRVNEMGRAYKTVKNDLFSRDKAGLRDYMNKLIELGIVKQSAGIGELRAMFKDADWDTAMIERINKNTGSKWDWVKSKFSKGAKFMEDMYQAEDDFFKIVAYENELSRYSKAMFGKSKNELTEEERAEVDQVVAEIVKNTYPTYSRIPELVNMIRRLPFIGNFISFQAESYRTAFNTAALSLDEIKSENPGVRQIGAQRLVGSITYMSAKTAILSAFSNAVGMGAVGILGYFTDDDEEKQKEDDVRKFLPEWSKNSDLLMLKASDGKIKYVDFSSSDPHGGINKAINSLLIGEKSVDGLINAMGSIIEPFIGEEMTTAAILAVKTNKNAYGKPIYNPEDTFYEKFKDISAHMLNTVQPGTVSTIRRAAESKGLVNELVGASTGMRIYEIDVAENFGYSMITYGKRIEDAKRIYNSEVYSKDATKESISNAKKRAEKAITNINKQIHGDYYSALRLGANEDVLFDNLKRFGRMSTIDMKFMFGEVPYLLKEKYAE